MNKELSKAIMTRTRLRNKFLENRTEKSRKLYTQWRNHCVLLLRKPKREFYSNINEKDVTDNKLFGRLSNLSSQIKNDDSKQNNTNDNNSLLIANEEQVAGNLNTFLLKL